MLRLLSFDACQCSAHLRYLQQLHKGGISLWPEQAQEEVDRVLAGDALPSVRAYGELRYLMRCVNESMRLYPHPPVLLRRAQVADTLPGALFVLI